jgi:hypothetical protein
MTRRAVPLLGVGFVLLFLSGCAKAPQRLNVLALVVEVTDTEVRLLAARLAEGVVRPPAVEARVAAIRRGDAMLIEYGLTAASGASAGPASVGQFIVSREAVAESVDDRLPGGMVRARSRIVTVAVPLLPDAREIAFTRVEPSPTDPVVRWKRIPAGKASLPEARIR